MRALRLSVFAALVGVLVPCTSAAAAPQSYHFSKPLYAVGCETQSQCVVIDHGSTPPGARLLIVRRGRVIRSVALPGSDYGNNGAVSCPSRHGCVTVVTPHGGWGAVVSAVDGHGRVTTRRVGAPNGVVFNSISCTKLTTCELAGTSTTGGGLAMASWNGRRRGRLLPATPPQLQGQTFGQGNDLPTVSCSAFQCEVAFNYQLLDDPQQQAYQAFLVHVRHGAVTGSGWASGLTADSLGCGTNRLCWAIVSASDGSSARQLAAIDDGALGTPQPLSVPANAIACWSFTCAVTGDDTITTFVSGTQTATATVPGAWSLTEAGAGPNEVFAATGSARPAGSVLAVELPAGHT